MGYSTTYVPPPEVEEMAATDFRILQNNARKFMINGNAQRRKKTAWQEADAFRAPTNNTRSFEPQYGDVMVLESRRAGDGPDKVRNTGQGEKFHSSFVLETFGVGRRCSIQTA